MAGFANPIEILTDAPAVLNYLKGEGASQDRREFPFPGVLFLDVHLPGASGFDVLQWLRDHPHPHIAPILIFSTSQEPDDIVRAYQLGASAYIVKPGTTEKLAAILRRACDLWARRARSPLVSFLCVLPITRVELLLPFC